MKKAEEPNAFDELRPETDPEELKRQAAEWEARRTRRDYLVHRVFAQTEEGRELLELCKVDLIKQPSAAPNMGLLEIGIREGMKKIIRDWIEIVEQVDKGER